MHFWICNKANAGVGRICDAMLLDEDDDGCNDGDGFDLDDGGDVYDEEGKAGDDRKCLTEN